MNGINRITVPAWLDVVNTVVRRLTSADAAAFAAELRRVAHAPIPDFGDVADVELKRPPATSGPSWDGLLGAKQDDY